MAETITAQKRCERNSDFNTAQISIISNHLELFKSVTDLPDKNDAVSFFIKKYAWGMRTVYCVSGCSVRESCEIREPLANDENLNSNISKYLTSMSAHPDFCSNLESVLKTMVPIVSKHIDMHKWCRGIPDYQEGVKRFVNEYGLTTLEMYCKRGCPDKEKCEYSKTHPEDHKHITEIKRHLVDYFKHTYGAKK